jgi:hypothetical protein
MNTKPPHSPADHALALNIARGAAKRDFVQLHGGIVLALERHGIPLAFVNVFKPALRIAQMSQGEDCRLAVADAIQAHINQAGAEAR